MTVCWRDLWSAPHWISCANSSGHGHFSGHDQLLCDCLKNLVDIKSRITDTAFLSLRIYQLLLVRKIVLPSGLQRDQYDVYLVILWCRLCFLSTRCDEVVDTRYVIFKIFSVFHWIKCMSKTISIFKLTEMWIWCIQFFLLVLYLQQI